MTTAVISALRAELPNILFFGEYAPLRNKQIRWSVYYHVTPPAAVLTADMVWDAERPEGEALDPSRSSEQMWKECVARVPEHADEVPFVVAEVERLLRAAFA